MTRSRAQRNGIGASSLPTKVYRPFICRGADTESWCLRRACQPDSQSTDTALFTTWSDAIAGRTTQWHGAIGTFSGSWPRVGPLSNGPPSPGPASRGAARWPGVIPRTARWASAPAAITIPAPRGSSARLSVRPWPSRRPVPPQRGGERRRQPHRRPLKHAPGRRPGGAASAPRPWGAVDHRAAPPGAHASPATGLGSPRPAPHRGGPASRSGGLPRRLRASALRPHVLAAAAHDRPGGLHGGPARRCPGRGSRAGPAGALRPRWRRGACAPAAPQARGGAAAPLTAVCARAPAGRARGALDERPLAHRHVRHLDAWQKGQGPGWLARPARPAGIRAQTTFHGWPQTAYTAINHPDLV